MDRCVTCQYYDRQRRGADAAPNAGQCRREAPSLSPLNQKTYMIEGVWPTVRDDDWCGEWKALVRRVEPARVADALAAVPTTSLPSGAPRPGAVPPPPPRRPVLDAIGMQISMPGLAASGRGDD